jgi:hypothetical protein
MQLKPGTGSGKNFRVGRHYAVPSSTAVLTLDDPFKYIPNIVSGRSCTVV